MARKEMTGKPAVLKEVNIGLIMDTLRRMGNATRVELSRETGISQPTINVLIKELTEKERLTDMKKEDQTQISSKLPGSSYLKIPDAGKLYLQDTETARPSENGWTGKVYFNEAMVIYHLLH